MIAQTTETLARAHRVIAALDLPAIDILYGNLHGAAEGLYTPGIRISVGARRNASYLVDTLIHEIAHHLVHTTTGDVNAQAWHGVEFANAYNRVGAAWVRV